MVLGVLLATTTLASVEYYRQIRKAQKAYEKAKTIVEDIVLSFNRELRREAERIELIAFKVEGNIVKSDTNNKMIDNLEKKILPLENQISVNTNNSTNVLPMLNDLSLRIKNLEVYHEGVKAKISSFEEQLQKFSVVPEAKLEPVIPIKRDKAMAALTETEVAVLELLSSEGPKTAPEIKERIQLSREHTARLMKKLYETGYLERETDKIPFRYRVKKEMESLLEKPEYRQS